MPPSPPPNDTGAVVLLNRAARPGARGADFFAAVISVTLRLVPNGVGLHVRRSRGEKIVGPKRVRHPGGREGLETYEAFASRKAFWTKGPTRASLVTVGLGCLLQEASLSWRLRALARE